MELQGAVRDAQQAEAEADRIKADANLRVTEVRAQKAQVEADAARRVVSIVCSLSLAL